MTIASESVSKDGCFRNSPSKIDQWCKPKPAAKLVLALVRRSPLMLKERAGGSMTSSNAIVASEVSQC